MYIRFLGLERVFDVHFFKIPLIVFRRFGNFLTKFEKKVLFFCRIGFFWIFIAKGKFLKVGALFFEKKKGFGYSPKPFEFYSEQLTNYLRRRYVVNCNIKLHLNTYSIYSNFSRKSYTKNLNFFIKKFYALRPAKSAARQHIADFYKTI